MIFSSLLTLKRFLSHFLIIFSTFSPAIYAGSNYFLEDKIAHSLKETKSKKDIVWLKTTEKREILALLSMSKISDIQGGIIILSDLFQSPDWPIIIHGLRTSLPNFGWETLSVQLPIPTINPSAAVLNSTYGLVEQRISSAVAYFKNKNIGNIILIGINQSANFSLKYVHSLPEESTDLQALICIRAFDSDWLTSSDLVKNIAAPMLDIIPEHDSDPIFQSARKRLVAANFAGKLSAKPRFLELSSKVQNLAINKTGNLRYRQKIINGASFNFDKQERTLIKVIRGWLSVYASGQEITVE